jgi:LPXTG-motif cell wall-anchored protein
MKRGFDNFGAMERISKSNDFEFFNLTTASERDAEKNKLILKLPYSYQRVLIEPRYSEFFPSLEQKAAISNDLTQVAVDTTLTPDEKKLQAMALLETAVPSLAPEFDPNSVPNVDDSLRSDTSEGNFVTKNKWVFIIGGVLLVGGIATFLILRRRKK